MTKIIDIDPRQLQSLPSKNPNTMDPESYASLLEGMRKYGFLQPILVVEEEGVHTLIDGFHRAKAAQELGYERISAVVAKDRAHAEILRIAMNKLRGQLDLTEVSRQLDAMLEDGIPLSELELTGFPEWEIKAMVDTLSEMQMEETLEGADIAPPTPEKKKSYNITLKFASESERARMREFFEDYGDGDFIAGLKYVQENFDRK